MNNQIIDITVENFQQAILEQSNEKLVLVAFWADQIPESIELKNKLATILAPHQDAIQLVAVDCQAQQQIAMQFGIQGLPTAILVKEGQPIDGISGPQTDETLSAFLEKHLPKIEDTLLANAKKLLADGQLNEAFQQATQAFQANNERADIQLTLADINLQLGQSEPAQKLLESIKMVDQDSYYQALMAKLELALEAADSPEIKALEQQVNANPKNCELTQKLAAQYSQVGRNEEALALLFDLVRKDGTDATSKQLLLDVMKSLPDGDALAGKYRRKLFSLLY